MSLKIRDDQITAFGVAARRDPRPAVARYLRERMTEHVRSLDDDALDQAILGGIARAARHGVEIEWDLCRFVRFELLFGPGFDERCGWARGPLGDGRLSGTEKMRAIEQFYVNYLRR